MEDRKLELEALGMSKRAIKALVNAKLNKSEDIALYIKENSGWCMCESNEKGCLRGIGRKTGKEILDCLYTKGVITEAEHKKQLLNISLSSYEENGKHKRIHPRERDQILSHS